MYLWDLKAKKKTFSSYKWEGGIRTKVFHMNIKSQELLTQKKKKKRGYILHVVKKIKLRYI